MLSPGKKYKLRMTKVVDFGVYLDGGDSGEILLPMKWVPENTKPTDLLDVFIYLDSEERLIATTIMPYATVGDFAYLKINAVNDVGAFVDWGLEKDLLLPYKEQRYKVEKDKKYVVYIYSDERGRIAASTLLEKYIDNNTSDLQEGQEVDLLLYAATDLGFKAIINNRFEGIIYANEVFQQLERGQKIKGFIKKIRDDGKVDLSLYKTGYSNKIDDLSEKVLQLLNINDGFLELTDHSTPEEIYLTLGISKKNFKQTIGKLLKLGHITIEDHGIRKSKDILNK